MRGFSTALVGNIPVPGVGTGHEFPAVSASPERGWSQRDAAAPLFPLSGQCFVCRALLQTQLHQGTVVPEQPWQHSPAEAEGLWCFSCKSQTKEGTGMSPGALAGACAGEAHARLGCPGQRLQEQELRPWLPGAQGGPDCCPGAEPPLPRGLGPRAAQEPPALPSFAAPWGLPGLAWHHLGPRLWWLLAPAAWARPSPVPSVSRASCPASVPGARCWAACSGLGRSRRAAAGHCRRCSLGLWAAAPAPREGQCPLEMAGRVECSSHEKEHRELQEPGEPSAGHGAAVGPAATSAHTGHITATRVQPALWPWPGAGDSVQLLCWPQRLWCYKSTQLIGCKSFLRSQSPPPAWPLEQSTECHAQAFLEHLLICVAHSKT